MKTMMQDSKSKSDDLSIGVQNAADYRDSWSTRKTNIQKRWNESTRRQRRAIARKMQEFMFQFLDGAPS
jgi:hypothetical protein